MKKFSQEESMEMRRCFELTPEEVARIGNKDSVRTLYTHPDAKPNKYLIARRKAKP